MTNIKQAHRIEIQCVNVVVESASGGTIEVQFTDSDGRGMTGIGFAASSHMDTDVYFRFTTADGTSNEIDVLGAPSHQTAEFLESHLKGTMITKSTILNGYDADAITFEFLNGCQLAVRSLAGIHTIFTSPKSAGWTGFARLRAINFPHTLFDILDDL